MLTEHSIISHDIRGEFKYLSEITDTVIRKNGVEISTSRHRGGVTFPGALNAEGVYVATNTSSLSQDMQDLAATCWTPAIHTAYEAELTV